MHSGLADELLVKGRIVVKFWDTEVLVVRTHRKLYAIENRCPHLGRELADAPIIGQTLTCPDHSRRYDLASAGRWNTRLAAPPGCVRSTSPSRMAGSGWHLNERRDGLVRAVLLVDFADGG